eukprot:gene7419-9120_t
MVLKFGILEIVILMNGKILLYHLKLLLEIVNKEQVKMENQVTVTSEYEQNFLITNFPNQKYWISGSDLKDPGFYKFNSGPEKGLLLYDNYFDICQYFCFWPNGEPNLKPGENYIHYNSESKFWNNNANNTQFFYICEYGGINEPFIESISSNENKITIKDFNSFLYQLPTLYVNFKHWTRDYQFNCTNIVVSAQDYTLTCNIPPGTGDYEVTISDGSKTEYTTFKFNNPSIYTLYPKFKAGEVVTITGDSFGTDPSLIQISFQPGEECTSITFLSGFRNVITCILQSNIKTKFLPITIKVDSQAYTSYKAAFYSTFANARDMYAHKQKVEGLQGNLGIVDSQELGTLLQKTCPTQTALFMGVAYNVSSSTNFTIIDGPKIGKEINLYYSSIQPFLLDGDKLSIQIDTLQVSTFFSGLGTLTEFSFQDAPTFNLTGGTIIIPTNGSAVSIVVNNLGNTFSNISVSFNGNVYRQITRDFIDSHISFMALKGFGGPHSVLVTVEDKSTLENQFFIDYLPPQISRIYAEHPIKTQGGIVTIEGSNFYDDPNAISVYVSGATKALCSELTVIEPHQKLTCRLPSGHTSSSVVVSLGGKRSAPYIVEYEKPIVDSIVHKVGIQGGVITIHGQNFFDDKQVVRATVGENDCVDVSILVPHFSITCKVPKGVAGLFPVHIFVADQKDTSNVQFSYMEPFVREASPVEFNVGGLVTIFGTRFGESNLKISIGTEDCSEPTFIDETRVHCKFSGKVEHTSEEYGLNVTVSAGGLVGSGNVFYYLITTPCLGTPKCSGNGECYQGVCKCNKGFLPPDCSKKGDNGKPPTGVDGNTTLPSNGFSYSASITYLREISFKSESVKFLKMSDITWTQRTQNPTDKHQVLKGIFKENNVTVDIDYTIFDEDSTIIFAGDQIEIPANSVKYIIKISGWKFESTMNRLQVIYSSNAPKYTDSSCEGVESTSDDNTPTGQFQVNAGGSLLQAKFASKLFVDNRVAHSKLRLLSEDDPLHSKKVSPDPEKLFVDSVIVVPYFTQACEIDPSFSTFFVNTHDGNCDSQKWRLPVIISLSVAGGISIAVASAWLIKRKITLSKQRKMFDQHKKELEKMHNHII